MPVVAVTPQGASGSSVIGHSTSVDRLEALLKETPLSFYDFL
jgi:hypothetical protein